jgi:hypothetical protein
VPGATDDVDVAGFALTQGTVAQVKSRTDSSVGNTGSLTLTGDFECHDVQEVPIIVPNGVTALLDFGDGINDGGCQYSGSGNAIECQSGGTVTDVWGSVENSGAGAAVYNLGTWGDFSGSMENSGVGSGVVHDDGTWDDFSGDLVNSGEGSGFACFAAMGDFSGVLRNTGEGIGFYDESGVVDDVSGTIIDSGSGIAFYSESGTLENITGLIGRPSSQADLLAENILLGKTILGIAGTAIPHVSYAGGVENMYTIISGSFRGDRVTVFRPHTPLSGDILDGVHSIPQSGVRVNYDYPDGV